MKKTLWLLLQGIKNPEGLWQNPNNEHCQVQGIYNLTHLAYIALEDAFLL